MQGPELLLREPAELSGWAALRCATSSALRRGKLDTYLWWRYAGDAQKLLTDLDSEAVADATEVVLNCARAHVEGTVYSAWLRAVCRSRVPSCVAPAVCELSRFGLLPPNARSEA